MTWLAVLNFLMIAMIISVLSYFVYEQVRIRDATNKNDTNIVMNRKELTDVTTRVDDVSKTIGQGPSTEGSSGSGILGDVNAIKSTIGHSGDDEAKASGMLKDIRDIETRVGLRSTVDGDGKPVEPTGIFKALNSIETRLGNPSGEDSEPTGIYRSIGDLQTKIGSPGSSEADPTGFYRMDATLSKLFTPANGDGPVSIGYAGLEDSAYDRVNLNKKMIALQDLSVIDQMDICKADGTGCITIGHNDVSDRWNLLTDSSTSGAEFGHRGSYTLAANNTGVIISNGSSQVVLSVDAAGNLEVNRPVKLGEFILTNGDTAMNVDMKTFNDLATPAPAPEPVPAPQPVPAPTPVTEPDLTASL